MRSVAVGALALAFSSLLTACALAADCPVSHDQLVKALQQSVKPSGGPTNGGFDNNEWGAVVDVNGVICAMAFSGQKVGDQWSGSRPIAAEKAATANALSLDKFALSTANLYAGAQPAGFLFGLGLTSPPNNTLLYAGDPGTYGSAQDPFVGHTLGGVVVFGGGLALYSGQKKVGALGISGDSSCADHNVAWRVRHSLGLDQVPDGVGPSHNDEMIYDLLPDKSSASGYGHPQCKNQETAVGLKLGSAYLPDWAKKS
ncbi:MAG: heme-binding protein [Devosia sp.]